jgi:hypothetical protein
MGAADVVLAAEEGLDGERGFVVPPHADRTMIAQTSITLLIFITSPKLALIDVWNSML